MSKHFAHSIISVLAESGPLTSRQLASKLGKTRLQITCAMVRLQSGLAKDMTWC